MMAAPISTKGELVLGKPNRLFAANLRGGDGSLYVTDDGTRSVWRVEYTGK